MQLIIPDGAKREPYTYIDTFDKAAIRRNTILHYVETVADSKYSEFNSVISRECGYPEEALVQVSLLLKKGL